MQKRLFEALVPLHYRLELDVDPRRDEFRGTVEIEADVRRRSTRLILHSSAIVVDEAFVDDRKLPANKIRLDPKEETLTLNLSSPCRPGKTKIRLVYHAAFNTRMRGLYLAKSQVDGKAERYAFTKFEPAACRQMLPCIDEPEAKATFDLTVSAPADMTVLSNTPVLQTTKEQDLQRVTFATTPKMSTYLLALVVARLKSKSIQVGATRLSAWAVPQAMHQVDFALDAGRYSLEWLNEYFGLPYPLDKLDLVAVPEFSSNGMENWGLITFRDSAMLVDPTFASDKAKRQVAVVVAHEVVHQWFGNLVTMRWWNDLWLNEAFATWMSFKVLDAWKPDWDIWLDFERGKATALKVDALDSTRPVVADVASMAEILAMFDFLTYVKGGAILRMIESLIGAEEFRRGIRAYMKKYQYGNTEAVDLWNEFEKVSRAPVAAVAKDWLTRPGFPLISIRRGAVGGRRITLAQKRFSSRGPSVKTTHWKTPATLRYQLEGEGQSRLHRLLVKGSAMKADLPGTASVKWIHANAAEMGFYRVNVDGEARDMTQLKPAERLGFLDDLWVLLKNGQLSPRDFFSQLGRFRGENHWAVLEALKSPLQTLYDTVAETDGERRKLAAFVADLLAPTVSRWGWESASDDTPFMRRGRAAVLATLACVDPGGEFQLKSRQLLAAYLFDPKEVDPALVSFALGVGARYGDVALFHEYRRRLVSAGTPELRDQYLDAMGEFRRPEFVDEILGLTLTDAVLGQDLWKPFIPALRNPYLQEPAWRFVRARWGDLRKKGGDRAGERIMEATAWFWTPALRREAEKFFTHRDNRIAASERPLRQTLEEMNVGIKLKKEFRSGFGLA